MKNRQKFQPRHALLTSAASLLIALSLNVAGQSATITWGTPTNITPAPLEIDVITTGTLVGAANVGTTGVASTTVNGVPFAAMGFPDDAGSTSVVSGPFTLQFPTGLRHSTNSLGVASPPFSILTAPYQALLASGETSFSGTGMELVIAVTPGQAYSFQWWSNYSSAPGTFDGLPYSSMTATSGNAVTLSDNTISGPGGLGQYAIGTFTANSSTQVIAFTWTGAPGVVNGFQLRAVPEPSSTLLLLASAGMLAGGTRFGRQRKA